LLALRVLVQHRLFRAPVLALRVLVPHRLLLPIAAVWNESSFRLLLLLLLLLLQLLLLLLLLLLLRLLLLLLLLLLPLLRWPRALPFPCAPPHRRPASPLPAGLPLLWLLLLPTLLLLLLLPTLLLLLLLLPLLLLLLLRGLPVLRPPPLLRDGGGEASPSAVVGRI
jgi:hypothetical protein